MNDNTAILNCDLKTLQLQFQGETFDITLYHKDKNLGEYIDNEMFTPEHNWHMLNTKDGKIWGLQFIWVKELDGILPRKPRIKIYRLRDRDGEWVTCNMHRIEITRKVLGHYDYFYQNEDWWIAEPIAIGMKIEPMKEFKM